MNIYFGTLIRVITRISNYVYRTRCNIDSHISVNLQAMSSSSLLTMTHPEGSLGMWSPPSLLSQHYVLSSHLSVACTCLDWAPKAANKKRWISPWETTLWLRVLFSCTPLCWEISSQLWHVLEQAQAKHLSNINHEEQAWEISVQKSVERAHYMWKQKIINGKRDLNGNNGMKKTEEGETAMKVVPLNQVGSFNIRKMVEILPRARWGKISRKSCTCTTPRRS